MYILHGSVLDFIGNGDYSASSVVVQILVLAALLNGIQYTISPGIHIKNKLVQESSIMIAAAFLNVGLNFLLIPPYGAQGAAISTLISYLIYLICTFSLSQICYPVSYHWRRMSQVLVTAIAFMGMIYWVDNILLQLCLVFVFILTGPVLDLYMNERDVLNTVLQKLRRKTVKGSQ
jgi:O-antigen/teichoic acid export membrane protein